MIHQVVPMLHVGDAVGRHAAALQDELVARGVDSVIYVELDDPETSDRTRPFATYADAAAPDDVLVYQFATASDLADQLAAGRRRLVVNYHNITPPDCFSAWDDTLANLQLWGRLQLSLLAETAELGVAVSETNRSDLVASGFRATAVLPPIVALPVQAPVRAQGGPPAGRGARWLAVGRLAPNKTLEATLAALFVYRAQVDPAATLTVVGRPSVPGYAAALRRYAAELGLADAVRFAGRVTETALAACYDDADVLVVSSVHEGFCLPAVEAMSRGTPVVAYREGALPEVVGDGGVLVDSLDPVALSDAVRSVVTDPGRRAQLAGAAARRLAGLDLAHAASRLADLVVAVHDRTPWPEGVGAQGRVPAERPG